MQSRSKHLPPLWRGFPEVLGVTLFEGTTELV